MSGKSQSLITRCSSISFNLIQGFRYLQFKPDALHHLDAKTPLKVYDNLKVKRVCDFPPKVMSEHFKTFVALTCRGNDLSQIMIELTNLHVYIDEIAPAVLCKVNL